MLKISKEFKEFAVKGNMFDIAIGVIIGASFNKVVDTLVRNILMPILQFLTDSKFSMIIKIDLAFQHRILLNFQCLNLSMLW